MKYSKKISNNLRLFWGKSSLKKSSYRKEFFSDIALINLTRLRIFSYFLVVFVGYSLYADFFLGDFWETNQVTGFMILDLILGFATIFAVLLTHLNPPKIPEKVKPIHHYMLNIWVLFHVMWATGISIVESSTANSVPTLLLGVFSAATIYIVRGYMFFIILIISFITLIFGLYYLNDISIDLLVTKYSSTVVLLVLAWIVSRILLNTRIRSFSENKDLEVAKNNLDTTVKERTKELRQTNKTLQEEVTERKRYAKSLEEEKIKAVEADRLKSVFLANMSHEIRTPLNGILGFSDLLQNQQLSEEKKLRFLEIINTNGERLLKLIDDIIDISMIESNQLKVNKTNFKLSRIFKDAFDFFENFKVMSEKENIEIINDGFPENVNDNVLLDPSRVQQVLYNLLSNAIKFTDEGSVRFGGKYDNAYALIYVEDTGIGIDSEKCYTIFERFRQGEENISRKFGGTGLGLSISKGIVELLGGMIWIDLSYTRGTRICYTLPTEDIVEEDLTKTSQLNIELLDKTCIVVHEDSENNKGAFAPVLQCATNECRYLPKRKYDPKTIKTKPSLVVIDIPDNKKETMACIKKTHEAFKKCHIIAITEKDVMTRKELVKAGCDFVLNTPVNFQVFLLYIRGLLS